VIIFVDRAVAPQVCAVLSGSEYAEKVVVPAGQLLPVPDGVSLMDAVAIPEVTCTVWSTVFMISHLSPAIVPCKNTSQFPSMQPHACVQEKWITQ